MHWFLNSLSSLPTIKWSTEKCQICTHSSFGFYSVSYLDKCPNTTLHVVTTTERGRDWGQSVGAFMVSFRTYMGNRYFASMKTLLPTILVTREVLRGSVALKELKRVRESIMLCSGLKVKFSSTLLKIWSKYISGFSHLHSNTFIIN